MKLLVIRSDEGKIVESSIVEGELGDVVKKTVLKAIEEWNPESSDFTVLRAKYEVTYSLPVDPNLVDLIREYNLEAMRQGNELIVTIPLYTISFDNVWLEDSYHDRKMYIIALYVDEEARRQIEEYAIEATKAPKKIESTAAEITLSEEDLKALSEGLEEIEEEKPKRKRGRRRRKKSSRE